jgi:predicted metal-dependent hydrolase
MRLANRSLIDLFKPALRARPAPRPPVPALDRLVVECEGRPIPVEVHFRDSARRMILKIDRRTGAPALTLPRGVGRIRAERFLLDHLGWLNARLKAQPVRIPFEDGAEIPYRGEMHRIVHRLPFRGVTAAVEEDGERLILVHGEAAHVASRVERFLKAEATSLLTEASARHAAALGVTIGRISIKDTRSRWGSCSARGDLAFSWRLVLAPAHVLDYLAAHEVAHRLEMNHSTRYWRHVARVFPAFRESEAWLTRHGASLHRFGHS